MRIPDQSQLQEPDLDERHSIERVTPEYWDDRFAVSLRHLFFAADDSAARTNQSYVVDGGWV